MGYEMFDKLCKKNGVTAYQVAKATGVSTATISSWKVGRYTPKADKLQKIADYFDVSIDYLMGNSPSIQTSDNATGYYTNPETAALAQKLFDDPQYRVLFDAAEDSEPEDLQMAADLLHRLKEARGDY